jgi:RNA polymerase-binding transcription factor DksA
MSKKANRKTNSSKAKKKSPAKKAPAKKAPAKKRTAKKTAKPASKTQKKSPKKSTPAKKATRKSASKTTRKPAAKKKTKTVAKVTKTAAKKASKAKTKVTAKKAVSKKATAKKAVSKKATAKKAVSKKAVREVSSETVKKPNAKAVAAGKTSQRKSFLNEMQTTLLSELQDLNELIRRKKDEHISLHGGRNADTTDTASEALDDELALQIAEIEARRRMMIRQALQHIGDGTFGICTACADAPLNLCSTCPYIPPMRLKAVPSARLCIECKQLEEEFGQQHLDLLKEEALAKMGDS